MNINRRNAVAALIAAGLLWGTTVPLSKLALEWLSPGWLTVMRFGLAAAILLVVARRGLKAAFTPAVLISGALGYGGSVMVQNAGITRTSVTHAALLIGAVPMLVAVIAAVWHRTVAKPVAWAGFAVSLLGVGLIAGGAGGGATLSGDGLVLISLLISATVTVAQARLLPGRDPVAVTAVQFLAAAVGALLVALTTEGVPAVPAGPGPVLAVLTLAICGTLLPFTLFAFGQSRVSAEVAGAFLNLEPLVGAIAGVLVFGDPFGAGQLAGGAAIMVGIALSSLPLLARGQDRTPLAAAGAGAAPGSAAVPMAATAYAVTPVAAAVAAKADYQLEVTVLGGGYRYKPVWCWCVAWGLRGTSGALGLTVQNSGLWGGRALGRPGSGAAGSGAAGSGAAGERLWVWAPGNFQARDLFSITSDLAPRSYWLRKHRGLGYPVWGVSQSTMTIRGYALAGLVIGTGPGASGRRERAGRWRSWPGASTGRAAGAR